MSVGDLTLRALARRHAGVLIGGLVLVGISRAAGLTLPAITGFVVDTVITQRQLAALGPAIAAVVVAGLVGAAAAFLLTYTVSRAAQRLTAELRLRLQAHVGRLGLAYHDDNRAGSTASRIMSEVDVIRHVLGGGLFEVAGGVITAIIVLIVMLRLSPPLAGLATLLLLASGWGLHRAFRATGPLFHQRAEQWSRAMGRLTESLAGIRVVKAYRAEGREHAAFRRHVHDLLDNNLREVTANSRIGLCATAALGVGGAVILYVGARQILAGSLTLGGFVTYSLLLGLLVAPVFGIVNVGPQVVAAFAVLARVRELLGLQAEDDDSARIAYLPAVEGDLRFENVAFAYQSDKPVLSGVSFHCPPGTVTALVGPSGAGKTTIISLSAAFYSADSGRVSVDGIDLSTVRLDGYRSRLGVVLQDPFLFDGSIRDNVQFSRPTATKQQFLDACRIARVDEFANRMPDQYETLVGERGVKLSGGQRQRISIARAILADPSILILDEATSSLDSESEAAIQHGLAYLMRGRTTLVIAHRLSTVRTANQILFVESGRIVERGGHDELVAARGRYWEMHMRQLGPMDGGLVALSAAPGGEARTA